MTPERAIWRGERGRGMSESCRNSRSGCTTAVGHVKSPLTWPRNTDAVAEVADYELTIDDFTNDLTGRDGLELLLDWASPPLAADLRLRVDAVDVQYREGTVEDGGEALGRYFRVDASSGWWWRRKPAAGQLADYISAHAK